ncbi:MAG TPA: hypothetical protein VK842_06060 [bacterium]|nr:hypothetical protein [bacterium]
MKTMGWVKAALMAAALALPGLAPAARIGVDPTRFSLAYLRSDQTEVYWSAALEQILRYYGLEVKQAEIARSVYGTNPDGSTRTDGGGISIDDAIDSAFKHWDTDDKGRKFTAAAVRWPTTRYVQPQAPSPRVLQAELSAGRPILALLKLPQGEQWKSGAASQVLVDIVIIDAADLSVDADGNPSFKSIEIRNPSITAKNPRDPGFVTLSPMEYKARISTYWTIQVKR